LTGTNLSPTSCGASVRTLAACVVEKKLPFPKPQRRSSSTTANPAARHTPRKRGMAHHPDPEKRESLKDLQKARKENST
jgi:hypothetical protein